MDHREHIQRAIGYMEDHLFDSLALPQCAAVSGYSEYYFVRIFSMSTGMTPMDYVRRRRLTEAVLMIAKGTPANAAAQLCGFGSPAHFSRLFRMEHGIALRDFKRRQSGLFMQRRLSLTDDSGLSPSLQPEPLSLPALTLCGIRFEAEDDPLRAAARAWNHYQAKRIGEWLLPKTNPIHRVDYGIPIYRDERMNSYFIGVEAAEPIHPETELLHMPPARYGKFTTPPADQMTFSEAERLTWEFIHKRWLPQTGLAMSGAPVTVHLEGRDRYRKLIYIPLKEEITIKKLEMKLPAKPEETTGFLHTFTLSLRFALSAMNVENPDDAIATTGFAFRIWADPKTLCPSAMSIWDFNLMPAGVRNAGYDCEYIGRMWGEDSIEEERRLAAHAAIKASIESGVPAIAWDLGVAEWGLITGYDDAAMQYDYLDVSGAGKLPYDKLGMREIPILSVMTIKGTLPGDEETRMRNALKIAADHARGMEYADENVSGLAAYDALIALTKADSYNADWAWSWKYYLGTYCDLRFFAWKYLRKIAERHPALAPAAEAYHTVFRSLRSAFDNHESEKSWEEKLDTHRKFLQAAADAERAAIEIIEEWLEKLTD